MPILRAVLCKGARDDAIEGIGKEAKFYLMISGLSSDLHPLMSCRIRLINGSSISLAYEFSHFYDL